MNGHLDVEHAVERAEWVRSLARALVRDEHEAEDVAQEAWLAALTKRPASGESWSAWMSSVVRNFARARWRSDRRRTEREREVARAERQPSERELLDPLDSHALLVRCVRELDEPYRGAIVLRYFEGLTPKQIAERTDTSRRTVNTHLHRALALLRKRLDQLHRGNRDAWCALFAPLAHPSGGAAAGALIVSTKVKLALAALLIAGLLAGYATLTSVGRPGKLAVANVRPLAENRVRTDVSEDIDERAPVESPAPQSAPSTTAPDARPSTSPPRRVLHGTVIDIWNRPLADVAVVTRRFEHEDAIPGFDAVSDSNGEFTLPDPQDDLYIDVASAEWTAVLRPHVDDASAALVHMLVLAPRARRAGIVVDELGAPIAGVRVRIDVGFETVQVRASIPRVLDTSAPVRWETRSSADGRYEFDDAPGVTEWHLIAEQPGFVTTRFENSSSGEGRIVMRRIELGHLSGTVVDEARHPVNGARVVLIGDLLGLSVSSNRAGEFDLTVDPRDRGKGFVLRATVAGRLPALLECPGDAPLDTSAWPSPLVLVLGGKPLSIDGRVVDADGHPLAQISVENIDRERLDRLEPRDAIGPISYGSQGVSWAWTSDVTSSAADGSFGVSDLRPGSYRLRLSDTGSGNELETEPIEAGSHDVVLRMPREEHIALVAGRVVNPAGAPLAGVEVWLQHASHATAHVMTNEAGAFEFRDVLRAPTQLWASTDGFTSRVPHDLASERDLEHLTITAARRCHFQLDLSDSGLEPDGFEVRDAQERPLAILLQQGSMATGGPRWKLTERKTPALAVTEDGVALVLLRGDEELARIPVRLQPSELTIVRP
jgi:RNA polymerase sigma-70 factor (ECF subfamily)